MPTSGVPSISLQEDSTMWRTCVDSEMGICVERELLTDGSKTWNLVIVSDGGKRLARIRTNLSESDALHLMKLVGERVVGVEPL
jgi:hypothetical protein